MEQINLSTHGKEIQKAYEQIVRGEGSATWAIYGPDSSKAYKVSSTGADFEEFLESFDESQIQFGLARVNPPGSDVQKNLLVGWCPDSAPLKPRSSFAQNFAEVSRLLKGYHVQITARDADDLDKDELLSRLSAAAGARYSIQSSRSNASPSVSSATPSPVSRPIAPKPAASKPNVPQPTPSPVPRPVPVVKPEPKIIKPSVSSTKKEDEDEWNEPEVEERDFEKNPLKPNTSSWKPIGRVNLQDVIREEKSRPDPRLEIEQLKQKDKLKKEQEIEEYLRAKPASFGAKAPSPAPSFGDKSEKLVGGISKSFGAENGKTPAQLWAEKKQRAAGVSQAFSAEEKPTAKDEEDVAEEEQEDVADLKSKFDKLTTEAEAEEEAERTLPSPGFRSAYPGNAPLKNIYDFEDKPAPKLTSAHSPGASNAFPPKLKNDERLREQEQQPEVEEEEELQEEEKEEHAPTLPTRSQVPPPPARPEPETEEELEEPEEEEEEQREVGVSAIAEYDYDASEDNELTFKEGDRIIKIEFIDEDWWLGELPSGDKGLFPANYVTLEQ